MKHTYVDLEDFVGDEEDLMNYLTELLRDRQGSIRIETGAFRDTPQLYGALGRAIVHGYEVLILNDKVVLYRTPGKTRDWRKLQARIFWFIDVVRGLVSKVKP